VSDDVLDDLQRRLAQTRWPDALPGAGWAYGTDLGYMQELVDYWLHQFDWRKQEQLLNAFSQFTTRLRTSTSISFT
jgi:epoxide hydrolase